MAIPDQIIGLGTQLQVDRGAGYVAIARLTEIGEFRPTRDDIDVTTHDSANGWRDFRPGLVDPGELTFTGVWIGDTTQVALITDITQGISQENIYSYRIVVPRGLGTFTCEGYLRDVGINPQMDGRIEFSGVLKWTGLATFAVTESAGLTTPFFTVSGAGTTIVPAAAQAVTEYVVNIATGIASVTITPTASVGVIRVNGTIVASGVASGSITLGAAGSITIATITVTETSKVEKTYTLRLTRA